MWRSLRRLGIRDADARDAAQEVFIVVARRLHTFEGRSRITSWLFGICLNVARDRRRIAHSRRELTSIVPVDEQELPSLKSDPASDIEHQQHLALLEALLDELPLEQRAIFGMFELDGLTGQEISVVLDLPLGTVHSRLRLAREGFKQSLCRRQAKEDFGLAQRSVQRRASGGGGR